MQNILSNKECHLLLRQLYRDKVTANEQKIAIRNCAMLALMLDAGLRIGEVVNLLSRDLFALGKPVKTLCVYRGLPKGHTQRDIPLSEWICRLVELMDQYWWKSDRHNLGGYAFYKQSPVSHITARQFERIINQAALEVFGCAISPNILRQTCAVNLLQRTDLGEVHRLLDYRTDQRSFFY